MKIVHRSVYIGIGGTGIRAISHTKKMYNEAFGEGNIPPVIAFLGMDCDLCEFYQPAGNEILSPHEIVPLPMQSARMAFEAGQQQGEFDWMFPENIRLNDRRLLALRAKSSLSEKMFRGYVVHIYKEDSGKKTQMDRKTGFVLKPEDIDDEHHE